MSALPQDDRMTEAEYRAFELESEFKHEFLNGEVFAMTGASARHNVICAYTIAALVNQLRDRPCTVYPSDMRVLAEAPRLYAYPDVSVVCGDLRFAEGMFDTLTNPTLLVEVLSPSTEHIDRGRKFQHYRQIESLQEYMLIAQDRPHIEHYQRQSGDQWLLTDAVGLDATIDLPALGASLALADIYTRVTFEADTDTADE